ncbi:MAG: NAD/FAD-binding protein [Gammaproteobacteria bacterium]|nr:NAD/FAD-binding protein [Gammaproteobacteria bacterium]
MVVVGTGISGLAAAWLLSRRHRVSLFEVNTHLGGHSNTVEFMDGGRAIPVDTGFIVYNERNYPNLVALFKHLGVPTSPSDMSFSASLRAGSLEYSGSDLRGLFAQPGNLFRARFWRMLRDIRRFYAEAPAYLAGPAADLAIGDLLARQGYSAAFCEDHLWPMAGAIWSANGRDIQDYPARALINFFANHGLLQLNDRPQWRTVTGGAREYVRRILADTPDLEIHRRGVARISRADAGVRVSDADGAEMQCDDIVLATHADEALALLDDASEGERVLLGAFGYSRNEAWLHEDRRLMPHRRQAWASWNYLETGPTGRDAGLCVTYWMNRLQPLPTERQLFVTLNPPVPPEPGRVHYQTIYHHPRFDLTALRAQKSTWSIQGMRNTWFCGAYLGYGFHEDGLQAGLLIAEQLGNVARPWARPEQASRVPLPPDLPALMGAA